MLTIYLRTLKDRRMTMLAYIVGVVAFMWMYVGLFPYVQGQAEELSKLVDAYPKGIMEAFGVTDIASSFSKVGSFLSTEMFSFIYPIMIVAIAAGFGSSAIAGEIEKGTIEFLLAQPISRMKLFFSKFVAGVTAVAIFSAMSVFSIIPLAKAYHVDVAYMDVTRFWVVAFLFGLAVLSLTFLASSIFSDKGKPSFIVTGVVVLMYVLNILATLKPSLSRLKDYSFFHYYNPSATLGQGAALENQMLWVFLGTTLIATLLAAWWFNRRDITTA